MLLKPVCLEGTWEFTLHLESSERYSFRKHETGAREVDLWVNHVIYRQVPYKDKFPSFQACPDSKVHVFHCGSVFPAAGIMNSLDPPNTSCPCDSMKVLSQGNQPQLNNWGWAVMKEVFWKKSINRNCFLKTHRNQERDLKVASKNLHPSMSSASNLLTIEPKKWICRWTHFLLNTKVIVKWHLLKTSHQTFVCIHCQR